MDTQLEYLFGVAGKLMLCFCYSFVNIIHGTISVLHVHSINYISTSYWVLLAKSGCTCKHGTYIECAKSGGMLHETISLERYFTQPSIERGPFCNMLLGSSPVVVCESLKVTTITENKL